MVVVNESYPSECIQFRSVLNHSQLRFRVDGITAGRQQVEPVAPVSPDTVSNHLNEKPNNIATETDNYHGLGSPAHKHSTIRGTHSTQQTLPSQPDPRPAAGQVTLPHHSKEEGGTPTDSLDAPWISTIPESDPQRLTTESFKDVVSEQPVQRGNSERDALDDIIDEAKATSHLVSSLII